MGDARATLGRLSRRRLTALAAVVVAGALGGVAWAAGSTTIGQTGSDSVSCGNGYIFFNEHVGGGINSYAAPTNGVITSFSVAQGSVQGSEKLKILRKAGPSSWLIVAGSGTVTVPVGSGVSTFSVHIAVKQGDLIGLYNGTDSFHCDPVDLSTSEDYISGDISPGSTASSFNFGPDFHTNLSATLVPTGGGGKVAPIPQVNHVFLRYSKYQTDPGTWDSDTAALLLKAGYWLPYALPDAVDGATNLGDFHLACNLTGTQKATGTFVDDGGGTWSADYASMAGLYPAAG